MKVRKYVASCGYIPILVLLSVLCLVSDKTANGSYVVNGSI